VDGVDTAERPQTKGSPMAGEYFEHTTVSGMVRQLGGTAVWLVVGVVLLTVVAFSAGYLGLAR
jgi:hypothetical protein